MVGVEGLSFLCGAWVGAQSFAAFVFVSVFVLDWVQLGGMKEEGVEVAVVGVVVWGVGACVFWSLVCSAF